MAVLSPGQALSCLWVASSWRLTTQRLGLQPAVAFAEGDVVMQPALAQPGVGVCEQRIDGPGQTGLVERVGAGATARVGQVRKGLQDLDAATFVFCIHQSVSSL